jgi:hypothetical protein
MERVVINGTELQVSRIVLRTWAETSVLARTTALSEEVKTKLGLVPICG